jgi:hypothetical protein
MSNSSIYDPPWKLKLPGPGKYEIIESITKISSPSAKILPRPKDAPDSRTSYPSAAKYNVPRWPKKPFDENPHIREVDRYTNENAHAMPGGIYEAPWRNELPGPGSYNPNDVLEKPRINIYGRMNPHDTWRTKPIPEWKQEINDVPFNVLPSTLATKPSAKICAKPKYANDSRLSYPAPHDTAPPRWPNTIPKGFHNKAAMEYPYERAHAMNGGIYDPQWKVELPGPGYVNPKYSQTKMNNNLGCSIAPLTLNNSWRTAPLPLWKQEVNNVGHVLLASSVKTQPAVKIQGKPYDPPDSRSSYPAPDKYSLMRWPKKPYDINPHDDIVVAKNFTQKNAQDRLENILREEFPLEYDKKIHINPAAANYHIKDEFTRPRMGTLGGTMIQHDTWRTKPIPLWKQEVNNVGHVLLPSTLAKQPAVKIQSKPTYPDEDSFHNPGPGMYDVQRFPKTHHDPYNESGGTPGLRHTTSTNLVKNRPRSRPSERYPSAKLHPVDLPSGFKRGYSEQMKQWYWYDPSGKLPMRLAPEDSSRWLAKRAKHEILKQAAIHKTKGSRSPKPSELYAEDGGKVTSGVIRKNKKWRKYNKNQILSQGTVSKDWSSPFLDLSTHRKTKSGLKVPRQSTTTLPLSSLMQQKHDLLEWVKSVRGPNVTANGPPIHHGMYVKSNRPSLATPTEISNALMEKISGMNDRLEQKVYGVHPSWENVSSNSVHKNRVPNTEEERAISILKNDSIGEITKLQNRVKNGLEKHFEKHRVEEEKEGPAKEGPAKESGGETLAKNDVTSVAVGDQVFYKMLSGLVKLVTVVSLPTEEEGWVLQTRLNGPLLRQVCSRNITFGNIPPKCICGKHGAHKSKCYRYK